MDNNPNLSEWMDGVVDRRRFQGLRRVLFWLFFIIFFILKYIKIIFFYFLKSTY